MSTIEIKVISSLEKCLYSDRLEDKKEKKEFYMFKNERLSFQIAFFNSEKEIRFPHYPVRCGGALAKYATVRRVVNVPVAFPYRPGDENGVYIKKEPGLYPDLLQPLHYNNAISSPYDQLHAVWVDIELPENFAAGEYDFTFSVYHRKTDEVKVSTDVKIHVIDALLPEQKLIHTEWFYTDCIAQYYNVKAFSEKHWKYIESFMRTATKNGINMVLTPVFTPELDTYIGGERLTTQLVDITAEEDGKYSFDFKSLHRWIDLALDCGFKYFEIPHFFTQWGAEHAPKIIAKVGGRKKRIFGWDTDSMGEEYGNFLSQFIPALICEFKSRGLDKNCFFHVSDEPKAVNLEQYKRCKELIGKYLKGYHIIDALSDYEFYKSGVLQKPVPSTRHIDPFIENKVPGLWAYYCGSSGTESNRFFTMPTARTRILGLQLYLYNIEGFLHWGYNFYNNQNSYDVIDPFGYSDGEYFAPSGDMYLVYPGRDGKAWESIRLNAMREAVDDMRALSLYEEKFGREAAEKLIYEGVEGTIDFSNYPTDAEYLLNLREKIAKAFIN